MCVWKLPRIKFSYPIVLDNCMNHRYTALSIAIISVLVAFSTVVLLYAHWPTSTEFIPATSSTLLWALLFWIALSSQMWLGYLLWRLLHRRGQSAVNTDALHSLVHEFQTPITAIRMSADILDSPIARHQPERTDKYIRIIREETERLQHQVETMLTLARADRNTLILNREPIPMHSLLRAVAERHGDYLQLCMSGADPILLADRLHLTNVLHNLLDNAIKYSADEPEITLGIECNATGVLLAVRDRGVGISLKNQQQIFQPFFRVHDRQQPSVKGFGLGLSYVQRIVNAHHWRIHVTSTLGEGSEFAIRIPAASILTAQPMPQQMEQPA